MTDQHKKRILFVITKSNWGGAQRYVFDLATNLTKDEFEVAVALGGNGLLKDKLEQAGIPTYQIKNFERDINLLKEFRSMFEMRDIIRKVRPDVLHLNSSKAGGTGAFIARMSGVRKIIFTAHGWPFLEERGALWRGIVWFFSWLTALLAHTVILVSQNDFNKTKMPFVRNKSVVINTAIPTINFIPHEEARQVLYTKEENEKHEKDLYLVTIAELTQNKNLELAIKAVAEHNAKSTIKIFYTIIGDGELKDSLTALVQKEGQSEYVKFAGYITEARGLLTAFDAFVLPSKKEGMPYVILEAGLAGLPTLGSNVGGIPEIIDDGVSGILFDPHNPNSLTKAFEKITTLENFGKSLGLTLQNRIKKEFALSEMLQKTFSLYQ